MEGCNLDANGLRLDQRVDLALLEAGIVEIEGEFEGEHQEQNEETKENGCAQLGVPDAEYHPTDHYKRAKRGEWAEKENAGCATEVDGGDETKREIEQNESGVGEEHVEHTARGYFEVGSQETAIRGNCENSEQHEEREPTGDLCGENAAQHAERVILAFEDVRMAAHTGSAAAEGAVERGEQEEDDEGHWSSPKRLPNSCFN